MEKKKYGKFFEFNLIPPKTQEEIQVIEDRDNTFLYSFILIFSAAFIYFVLNLLQLLLIEPRINSIEDDIAETNQSISFNNEIIQAHGELVLKSSLLSPILEQDIKLSEMMLVATEIAGNSEIDSYNKEATGEIVISINVDTVDDAIDILEGMSNTENIEDPYVRTLFKPEGTNYYNLVTAFKITL